MGFVGSPPRGVDRTQPVQSTKPSTEGPFTRISDQQHPRQVDLSLNLTSAARSMATGQQDHLPEIFPDATKPDGPRVNSRACAASCDQWRISPRIRGPLGRVGAPGLDRGGQSAPGPLMRPALVGGCPLRCNRSLKRSNLAHIGLWVPITSSGSLTRTFPLAADVTTKMVHGALVPLSRLPPDPAAPASATVSRRKD
jgi:hypothetical protein